MLVIAIDNRSHAFGNQLVLQHEAEDAGIIFGALHFPVDPVIVGSVFRQPPAAVQIGAVGQKFGGHGGSGMAGLAGAGGLLLIRNYALLFDDTIIEFSSSMGT